MIIFFTFGISNSWATSLSQKINHKLKNKKKSCFDFSGRWEGKCNSGDLTSIVIEQSNCIAIKVGDFWNFFGSSQNVTDNFDGGIVQTTKLASLMDEKKVRFISNEEVILFSNPHQIDRTSSDVKINLIHEGTISYVGKRLTRLSGKEDQVEEWQCTLERI